MSLCFRGTLSDVHVYMTRDALVCDDCSISEDVHGVRGDYPHTSTKKFIRHLAMHKDCGQKVPDVVLARIRTLQTITGGEDPIDWENFYRKGAA